MRRRDGMVFRRVEETMVDDRADKKATCLATIGARNLALEEREENDYYATEPRAIEELLKVEQFSNPVYEPACGGGHMVQALAKAGYRVHWSDLVYRGYGSITDYPTNFLFEAVPEAIGCDIITNPPYKHALEFVERALDLVRDGGKVAMFLKLTFLESKKRAEFFKKCPPKKVYVFSGRIICARNGDFEKYTNTIVAYAWYVWEKGYTGETVLKWID